MPLICTNVLDRIDYIVSRHHHPKDNILAIEPRSLYCIYEELRAISIWAFIGTCHKIEFVEWHHLQMLSQKDQMKIEE